MKKPNIILIDKAPVPLQPRKLLENALFDHPVDQVVGRRKRRAGQILQIGDGDDRVLIQIFQHPIPVAGGSAKFLGDDLPVIFTQHQNLPGGCGGLPAHLRDPLEEEGQPSLPIAVVPYRLDAIIIFLTIPLEIIRQIQHRLEQHVLFTQQKRDEQPADASIAVQKRVDGLELGVDQADLDQQGQRRPVMEEPFQVAEGIEDFMGRGRNESGFGQGATARPDPVLAGSQLAGGQMLPPSRR